MAYYERHCHIRSIAFDIGRARTKFGPPEAGWGVRQGYMRYDTPRCLAIRRQRRYKKEDRGIHVAGPGCSFDRAHSGHR
ncbi:hypothetical protein BGZ57DRAFT_757533 [Hyaloscypha finlandica]|nr:hypothetical protein F5882DRAFT_420945 [Hyaloscypha sp. PMI_1271]KAH8784370.1 hypothetical protein BGZ57DRAFT_757533 [Hyaloscypha finlandica]